MAMSFCNPFFHQIYKTDATRLGKFLPTPCRIKIVVAELGFSGYCVVLSVLMSVVLIIVGFVTSRRKAVALPSKDSSLRLLWIVR